jgi:hypothetical protein
MFAKVTLMSSWMAGLWIFLVPATGSGCVKLETPGLLLDRHKYLFKGVANTCMEWTEKHASHLAPPSSYLGP